jgi:hypothetical protein
MYLICEIFHGLRPVFRGAFVSSRCREIRFTPVTKQAIDLSTGQQKGGLGGIDFGDLALDVGLTGVLNIGLEALLPTASIQGVTKGRGNPYAIEKALQTKLSNGTIQNMSQRTAIRSAYATQAANTYRNAAGAAFDTARNKSPQYGQ